MASVGASAYLMRNYDQVREYLSESQTPHLDLFPVLSQPSKATYFDDDPHTNAYGHELIATAIMERYDCGDSLSLTEDGLPPASGPPSCGCRKRIEKCSDGRRQESKEADKNSRDASVSSRRT